MVNNDLANGNLRGGMKMPVNMNTYNVAYKSRVYTVSNLMGHAKTDMTVQYYLIDDIDDMQYRYNVVNG